jgi:hypothetical protein
MSQGSRKPNTNFTAETRRRGEESGDRMIGRSGDLKNRRTAERSRPERTRRLGSDGTATALEIPAQILTAVVLSESEQLRGRVEGSRGCVRNPSRNRKFSRECLDAAWKNEAVPGSFDCAPIRHIGLNFSARFAQDDSRRESGLQQRCLAISILRRAAESVLRACQVFRATLREIFDESAYERFLLRTQKARSVTSYREFLREREVSMVSRPRCC